MSQSNPLSRKITFAACFATGMGEVTKTAASVHTATMSVDTVFTFIFFLETGFLYVAVVVLELTM